MKYLVVFLVCVCALALTFGSFSLTPIADGQISGRRLTKDLTFTTTKGASKHNNEIVGTTDATEIEGGKGDAEGFIYNADYGAIKTHPSPLPNHPKP